MLPQGSITNYKKQRKLFTSSQTLQRAQPTSPQCRSPQQTRAIKNHHIPYDTPHLEKNPNNCFRNGQWQPHKLFHLYPHRREASVTDSKGKHTLCCRGEGTKTKQRGREQQRHWLSSFPHSLSGRIGKLTYCPIIVNKKHLESTSPTQSYTTASDQHTVKVPKCSSIQCTRHPLFLFLSPQLQFRGNNLRLAFICSSVSPSVRKSSLSLSVFFFFFSASVSIIHSLTLSLSLSLSPIPRGHS